MRIVKDIEKVQWTDTAITIGKFDGVHIGHQKLLSAVLGSKKRNCVPVVFTFDFFPAKLPLTGQNALLLSEEEKQEKMKLLGMEYYVLFPFSKENASMEPERFVEEILVKTMNVKELYVGEDFCFGKDRKGNVELLEKLSSAFGFYFQALEKETYLGEAVSSSRIREAVAVGAIASANAMLGEPFLITGDIIHGKKLGRKMGIPTINIAFPESKTKPAAGVYCSKVLLDGKSYEGITNAGTKPTVQEEAAFGAETYLFDCKDDFYGKKAQIKLLHYIRPEKKFPSLEALMQQLEQDKAEAGAYFAAAN